MSSSARPPDGQHPSAPRRLLARYRRPPILAALVAAIAAVVTVTVILVTDDPEVERSPTPDDLGPFPATELDPGPFEVTLGINPTELTDEELDRSLDLAVDAGVTQIQSGATWWFLNLGRQPRDYDWTDLDRLLSATEARDLRVVLRLSGSPSWIHGGSVGDGAPGLETIWRPPVYSETQLRHWGDFVADVVSRYGNRVAFYELWNEPNGIDYWRPGPDPAGFASLLRTGYLRAKHADPDVLIANGGLSRNDIGYLETLYEELRNTYPDAEANGHFFDILGVHPYSRDVAPSTVTDELVSSGEYGLIDENFIAFTRMHDVLVEHGEGDKLLYLGEYGFSTTETWMDPVPDERRARYLVEAFTIAERYPYVLGLNWYDFLPYDDAQAAWAIMEQDGRPTATFEALRELEPEREPGPLQPSR